MFSFLRRSGHSVNKVPASCPVLMRIKTIVANDLRSISCQQLDRFLQKIDQASSPSELMALINGRQYADYFRSLEKTEGTLAHKLSEKKQLPPLVTLQMLEDITEKMDLAKTAAPRFSR